MDHQVNINMNDTNALDPLASSTGRKTPNFSTVSLVDAAKEEDQGTMTAPTSSVHKFLHGSGSRALWYALALIAGILLIVLSVLLLSDTFIDGILKDVFKDAYSFRTHRVHSKLLRIEAFRWFGIGCLWLGTYATSLSVLFLGPIGIASLITLSQGAKDEMFHLFTLSGSLSAMIASMVTSLYSVNLFGTPTETGQGLFERSYDFLSKSGLEFLFALTGVLFLRRFIVQRIAIHYHKVHYADRVRANNTLLSIIQTLKKYVLECVPYDPALFEGLSLGDSLAVFTSTASVDMAVIEKAASDFSKAIIKALRPADRNKKITITPVDFLAVFPQGDAQAAFDLLDKDGNGDLTSKELRLSIVEAFQERAAILRGLSENVNIVASLDGIFSAIVVISLVYLWMNIFDYNIKGIASTYAILAGFSWLFSHIFSDIFNSFILIFIRHPFDIGDRIIIDDTHVVVSEISLLTTAFVNDANGQIVYYRNADLHGKKITNVRRSGNYLETISATLDSSVASLERMAQLKLKLEAFYLEHARDFVKPEPFFSFDVVDLNKVKVSIRVEYRGNSQDTILMAARKSKLSDFFAKCVETMA